MMDFPSVKVTGAINIARARVIWHDGKLRFYTKVGRVEEVAASTPTKASGFWPVWEASTSRGLVRLSQRCSTCGGWRTVTRKSTQQLWSA